MQYPTAQLAIANLNGATFIGIDTLTAVKLKGGKKNPMQGRVTKVMRNASTMCFSNNIVYLWTHVNRNMNAKRKYLPRGRYFLVSDFRKI